MTDVAGDSVEGVTVTFTMVGPNGGEYIGPFGDGTPATASAVTNSSGNASVLLNSGNTPGPVTITANVTDGGSTYQTSSSVISIGGGVASASHFTLAVARKNLPGFVTANFTTTFTALVADRYNNFNVLAGASVTFLAEAGAIDTSNTLDATGLTTVTFRTQDPMPVDVPPTGPGNVEDGYVTVIAAVRGEESFADSNGNGMFDSGEVFVDLGEPFVDSNENRIRETTENFIDANNNGQWDSQNSVWDGPGCTGASCDPSPMVWTTNRIMFTGNIVNCEFTTPASPYNVASNGSVPFSFEVGDFNGNKPVPGTTIAITKSGAGNLVGQTSFSVPDGTGGPYTGGFSLQDDDTGTTARASSVTMTVTAGNNEVTPCQNVVATGTVN